MKFVCPLIVVNDIEKSKHFYGDILGQVIKYDFGENVQYDGDFSIHLKEHFNRLIDLDSESEKTSVKPNNFELYFEAEDELHNINDRLKNEGIEFIHEIREQPWGQCVLRVYDYDGHIVEIGESMESVVKRYFNEGMNIKDISNRTSMPIEFVQGVINEILVKK